MFQHCRSLESCFFVETADEENILLSQDIQDTLRTCEMDADEASADGEDDAEYYNKLLDELELQEVSILRRIAKKEADPTQLCDKVHRLGRMAEVEGGDGSARHRQSKLKNLRRSLKKSDEVHTSTGSRCSWVDVNEAECPTGIHRSNWLTQQRGYSWDLDWSVDNFKAHPRPLLLAIKDKMCAQFEYHGGLGDMFEAVFFQILCQQMRICKSNMKKLIKSGGPWNRYSEGYGGPHMFNLKR